MSDIDNREPEKNGVSRRTVTKAMAWAVPAIALAVPAPAFASSGSVTIKNKGACKSPGQGKNCADWNKGYILGFTVTNTHDHAIEITFSDLNVTTPAGDWVLFNNVVTVAAGGTETVAIGIDDQSTSEQTNVEGTVTACYYEDENNTGTLICIPNIPFSAATTNPCVQTFGTNCPPKG